LAWGCQQLGNGSIVSGLVIPPSQQQQQQTSTSYNNHTRPMILKSVSLPLISLTRLSLAGWYDRLGIKYEQSNSHPSYHTDLLFSHLGLRYMFSFFSLSLPSPNATEPRVCISSLAGRFRTGA
jgi:hypothetical protein